MKELIVTYIQNHYLNIKKNKLKSVDLFILLNITLVRGRTQYNWFVLDRERHFVYSLLNSVMVSVEQSDNRPTNPRHLHIHSKIHLHFTTYYSLICKHIKYISVLAAADLHNYIGLNVHNNVDTYYYRKQVLFRNWSKKSSHIDIFFIFFMQGCVNKYRPSKTRVHLSYIGSISYVL